MQAQSSGSLKSEPSSIPENSIRWYPSPEGVFDEVYSELGTPKPYWDYLVQSINTMGLIEIGNRKIRAQRMLRDDGATYNLNSLENNPKTWSLDPIPMLISSDEWVSIETGLIERSEIFNLIFKDIYGEQELIRQGIIPAEVIYGHRGFLRQCHGLVPAQQQNLLLQAMDLVRMPNGEFTVVADRTQTPNGNGYALENRTVLSRALPSIFRDSHVHRLSHYFQTLRQSLISVASHLNTSPRIVMLTPGAQSRGYFEHTLLANYLGFNLVHGSDLTVRNGYVWIKALGGLERVDVIYRQVDDMLCDQVELSPDSAHGIPNLLEVIRSGNVIIANPLGTGILETPAILKYLPNIAKHFLGREPILKSVQTWWCGNTEDRNFVTNNIESLIVRDSMRRENRSSYYGHELTAAEKTQLLAKINQHPHRYSAQPYLPSSHTANLQGNMIESRPAILRTFTVADSGSYSVMPGGLTRIGDGPSLKKGKDFFTYQHKDTWVIASEPESPLTLRDQVNTPVLDGEHENNLPSRVIENLFWMGRYAERAETGLRLLRTVVTSLQSSEPLAPEARSTLLTALSVQTGTLPGFQDNEVLQLNPDEELMSLLLDNSRPGSIKNTLRYLLNNTEEVKEMLSADTRKIINNLRDQLDQLDTQFKQGQTNISNEWLDDIITTLLALSGLNNESMLRGLDWQFHAIGRRTERAMQTAKLLKSSLCCSLSKYPQQQVLEAVLLSVEAFISFRRRYRSRNDIVCGLDLMMVDDSNPRSLFYQISELKQHMLKLPNTKTSSRNMSTEAKIIIKSLNDIQLTDLKTLAMINEVSLSRESLGQLMDTLLEQMEQFTQCISDKYFDHIVAPLHFVGPTWEAEQ